MVIFQIKDTLFLNRETLTAGFPSIPVNNPNRSMDIGAHTADSQTFLYLVAYEWKNYDLQIRSFDARLAYQCY